MENLFKIAVIIGIASLFPLVANGQTKTSKEFTSKLKLVAPMPIYEADPDNEIMKDDLFMHNGDSVRMARLAMWRIEMVNDSIDPSILIVKVIDTRIDKLPTYPMIRPTDPDSNNTALLDVRENFCAACEVWLRPVADVKQESVLSKDMRFMTNSLNVEILIDENRYEWPVPEKLAADFTFQIHENKL